MWMRRYPIEELAAEGDFIDSTFLLLHGELPSKQVPGAGAGVIFAGAQFWGEPRVCATVCRACPVADNTCPCCRSCTATHQHATAASPHVPLPAHPCCPGAGEGAV